MIFSEMLCKALDIIPEQGDLEGDCYPLLDWSFEDVLAYIVSNNVPYPHVYDVYSSVVGYENSRFVTFFDPEFETLNCGLDGVLMDEFRCV